MIGVSGYGDCHFRSILTLAEEGLVQFCAATVINPEEVPQKCEKMRAMGCRIYSNHQHMLKEEAGQIDLCCIPTGIGWHRVMTIDALNAGMHVLVEKPAAATLAEINAMDAAKRHNRREVFVGFQNMYADTLWKIKDLLVAGELGQLQKIRVCALWPRPHSYYKRTDWAGKLSINDIPVLDSPTNNAMAHFILMALFWSGSSREAAGTIRTLENRQYRAQAIESFDTFSARVQLVEGPEIVINMSHSSEKFEAAEIILETTRGQYYWNDKTGSELTLAGLSPENKTFPPFPDTRTVMFHNVCKGLQKLESNVCSLDLAREHTRFIERIHQSLKIEDIPASALKNREEAGETYTYADGLSEALLNAHHKGLTLHNSDLPWTKTEATT
nr:Gfo/Idh/MocA family oxidoreductase [Puniceicoccus vermicola]